MSETTVAQLLKRAQQDGLDRLDAQLLLLHAGGHAVHDRAWLLTHDQDTVVPVVRSAFESLVQRRNAGEPVAYITGHKEFFGLALQVDPRVLVPRPDTETLVEWALQCLQSLAAPTVIDLGTGSGAIALAIKHACADAQVTALDTSTQALAVARTNAQRLALELQWAQGNWLDGIAQRFDLIVSNPPYIADADPHLAQLQHEPVLALRSGTDGLDAIRHLVRQAPAHLSTNGWLLLEHGWDQATAVRALLAQAGFTDVTSRKDLAGIERCSGGRLASIHAAVPAPYRAAHKDSS